MTRVALGLVLGFIVAMRFAHRQRPPAVRPIRLVVDGRHLDAKVIDLALERRRRQLGLR